MRITLHLSLPFTYSQKVILEHLKNIYAQYDLRILQKFVVTETF